MKELGGEPESSMLVGEKSCRDQISNGPGFSLEKRWNLPLFRQKSPRQGRTVFYTDFAELERSLQRYVREGDIVLLKGSRSMELERLVDNLTLWEAGKIV